MKVKMFFAVLPVRSRRVPGGPGLRAVRLLQRDLVHAVPGVLEEALGRDGLQVRHGRPEAGTASRTEAAFYGEVETAAILRRFVSPVSPNSASGVKALHFAFSVVVVQLISVLACPAKS